MNKKEWKKEAKYQRERFKARGAELDELEDAFVKSRNDLNSQIGRLEKENDALQERIAKQDGTIEMQTQDLLRLRIVYKGVPEHLGELIRSRTAAGGDSGYLEKGETWLTPWMAAVVVERHAVIDFGRQRDVVFTYEEDKAPSEFSMPFSEFNIQSGGTHAGWKRLHGKDESTKQILDAVQQPYEVEGDGSNN